MRKILFASAAVAAIAIAAPAFAGDDTTNNQINRDTRQVSLTNLNNLTVGSLLVASGAAIGNTISVATTVNAPTIGSSGVAQDSTSVASAQVNIGSLQETNVNLTSIRADTLQGSAQSVGNNGSFSSQNGDIDIKPWQDGALANGGNLSVAAAQVAANYNEAFAYQNNDNSDQIARVNVSFSNVAGNSDSSALAVGNNLSFSAPNGNASAVAFQTNVGGSLQLAELNVRDSYFGGLTAMNSQSVGNASSWTSLTYGTADGINFQSNIGTNQLATTNVGYSNFGAGLNVGSVTVGNLATIK